jgi:hypothetical protein
MKCVLFSALALALGASCVAGNSSCPAEPSEEHLALVQRQASFLTNKVAPTSTYWQIDYRITGFRTIGCGDDWGSSAEFTFYGSINGCSTGCQRQDYNEDYGFTVGAQTTCAGSKTSSSASLQVGIEAFEDDKGSACAYNYGDDCHAKYSTTVSLPNTGGVWKTAELCSGNHCVQYTYSTTYVTPSPTPYPTNYPTSSPTDYPTSSPTDYPTSQPTDYPTSSPTDYPTSSPTDYPTSSPTSSPTSTPTSTPTGGPTHEKECHSWCEGDARSWDEKCGHNACHTCDPCSHDTKPGHVQPGGQYCEPWCGDDSRTWDEKCKFKKACGDCNGCL